MEKVVLDSNVLVAAGFNEKSSSAQLVRAIRAHRLRLMWHEWTRQETRSQLQKIPPLSWEPFAQLFEERNRIPGQLAVHKYDFIDDEDDRKFAALAERAEAVLVTNDRHLLSVAGRLGVPALTPGRAADRLS